MAETGEWITKDGRLEKEIKEECAAALSLFHYFIISLFWTLSQRHATPHAPVDVLYCCMDGDLVIW